MSEATARQLRADRGQLGEHGRRRVSSPDARQRDGVPVRGGARAGVHQAAASRRRTSTCRSRREAQLIANLRTQLEALNDITFSDAEWERFFTERIAGANDGIVEKTVRIQEDHVQLLKRDDGSTKNITLIDKTNIHNNRLRSSTSTRSARARAARAYANRYDVTVLVNGLPLVHVELKRRGVDIREAFNQIDRYQRDSFWAGSGLFEYVQLFVISNGTLTKYYSNTTRRQHLERGGRGEAGAQDLELVRVHVLVGGCARTSRSRT